jgi:diguanylate cyclase (GGDEF)-like protein/PAS domain S-box-containing protein
MKGLKSTFGDEFFYEITLQLNKIIGADYTFIARVDSAQQIAKTISMVANGEVVDNVEYGLKNTPCAGLQNDSVCIYPENICHLFSKDQMLIDMNIEGYLGVALLDSRQEMIGIIVALHKTKIKDPKFATTLFELFSGRIAAEMERVEQNRNLERLNNELAKAQAHAKIGSWKRDLRTKKGQWSDEMYRLFELQPQSEPPVLADTVNLIHPEDQKHFQFHHDTAINKGSNYFIDARVPQNDGSNIWIEARTEAVFDDSGTVIMLRGTAQDITVRKQISLELEDVKEYYRLLLDVSPSGIWHAQTNGDNIYVSPKFTEITGVSATDAKGIGWTERIHTEDKERIYSEWCQAAGKEVTYQSEFRFVRPDGIIKWVVSVGSPEKRNNKVVSWIGTITDITPMKAYQEQLESIAHYDALTSLPNRVLLSDRLSHAMVRCQRRNQSLAVAFMDLDGFKVVNDLHGHHVGDKLLVALSQRMKAALRDGDTLARIGGDEFIAIMGDLKNIEDSQPVLERLLEAASEPITVGELVMRVSVSIGVTIYPQDGVDADQLMRHADQAMYVAKQRGKNRYHVFDIDLDNAVNNQREIISDIRSGLERHEFVLHYQPKVNMHTGEVVGAEALIRWQHPERGLVPPLEFLPATEGHAVSLELGEWVINGALSQIRQWQGIGVNLPVSVNISAYQLQQANFTARLTALLALHPDVPPRCLELEILETSELHDTTQVSETMNACHALGVRFALDDFGTGYSSLTYLKRLPAYLIKIDQTFVRDMLEDADDLAIIEGVVGLAKAFQREVIAEGVETIAHGVALLELGCQLAQGYGIARPMPADDIPKWVSTWKPNESWQAQDTIEAN